MPVGGLLILMRNVKQMRFAKIIANQLQAYRALLCAKPHWNLQTG